jgi:transcriptional regulator with XRE-family HTH domain
MNLQPLAKRLTANVRAELARRGISHRDAAQALGLTQSAASRRMRGDVEFSLSEVEQLAALLEIPVTELLGEVSA